MWRLILVSVIATALGGAPTLAASRAVPAALVGKWTQGDRYAITFKSSGRVAFKLGSEVISETASGTPTRLTFGPAGVCTSPGTYRWKRAGQTVTFRPVTDSCEIRRSFLAGKWTKK